MITKVQSNGLAYEVSSFDGGSVSKVHHKYLRPWRELPPYIKRYLPNFNITEDLQAESESSSSGGFVPFVCLLVSRLIRPLLVDFQVLLSPQM